MWALGCIKGRVNLGLCCSKRGKIYLHGNSKSHWARDIRTKSLQVASPPWRVGVQHTLSLCSWRCSLEGSYITVWTNKRYGRHHSHGSSSVIAVFWNHGVGRTSSSYEVSINWWKESVRWSWSIFHKFDQYIILSPYKTKMLPHPYRVVPVF